MFFSDNSTKTSTTNSKAEVSLPKNLTLSISGVSKKRKAYIQQTFQQNIERLGYAFNSSQQESFPVHIDVQGLMTFVFNEADIEQDETVIMTVSPEKLLIESQTEIGALRGLAEISQLLFKASPGNKLAVGTFVFKPELKFRGLSLNLAESFLPVSVLKQQIDLMAISKLNVLMLTFTSDTATRIDLSAVNADIKLSLQEQYYSSEDLVEVIRYATVRGVDIVPSFSLFGDDEQGITQLLMHYKRLFPGRYLQVEVANVAGLLNKVPNEQKAVADPSTSEESELAVVEKADIGIQNTPEAELLLSLLTQAESYNRKLILLDREKNDRIVLAKTINNADTRDNNLGRLVAEQQLHHLSLTSQRPMSLAREQLVYVEPTPSRAITEIDNLNRWHFTVFSQSGKQYQAELFAHFRQGLPLEIYLRLMSGQLLKARIKQARTVKQGASLFELDTPWGYAYASVSFEASDSYSGRVIIAGQSYNISLSDSTPMAKEEWQALWAVKSKPKVYLGGVVSPARDSIYANNIDVMLWPHLAILAHQLWQDETQSMLAFWSEYQSTFHYYTFLKAQNSEQQREGFYTLAFKNSEVQSLVELAQQLTPAWNSFSNVEDQGKFNQLLPIMSSSQVAIQKGLSKFKQGDISGLRYILKQLHQWHFQYEAVIDLIQSAPKLSFLAPLAKDARTVNLLALTIAQNCFVGTRLSKVHADRMEAHLHRLYDKHQSTLLQTALVTEQLLNQCRR